MQCPLCQEGFRDKESLESHAMALHSINAEGLQRLNNLKNANKEEEEERDCGEFSDTKSFTQTLC